MTDCYQRSRMFITKTGLIIITRTTCTARGQLRRNSLSLSLAVQACRTLPLRSNGHQDKVHYKHDTATFVVKRQHIAAALYCETALDVQSRKVNCYKNSANCQFISSTSSIENRPNCSKPRFIELNTECRISAANIKSLRRAAITTKTAVLLPSRRSNNSVLDLPLLTPRIAHSNSCSRRQFSTTMFNFFGKCREEAPEEQVVCKERDMKDGEWVCSLLSYLFEQDSSSVCSSCCVLLSCTAVVSVFCCCYDSKLGHVHFITKCFACFF